MIMKRTTRLGKRILRRSVACFLAILGLWMFSLTLPGESPLQFLRSWSNATHFVTAALATELGPYKQMEADGVSFWQTLLAGESPLLSVKNQESASETPPTEDSPEEEDGEAETDLENSNADTVVERFFQPADTAGYEQVEGVYIHNRTSKTLDLAALASSPVELALPTDGSPQILIIHTHGSEAYTQTSEDTYNESGTARTTDTQYNIIRVGSEIERIFTGMGLSVLHDTTLYDYPSYNGSYGRSRASVERYLSEYPSLQLVIDVHRDALIGEDGTVYKPATDIDGNKTAQVLMVMGSDDGGLALPNWEKNLTFAMRIQHRMNTLWPGLARPISLLTSRFNQQLAPSSILVEIGSHGNTLQEALAGARLFARSAGQVLLELTQ